jgi:hypothetical protein
VLVFDPAGNLGALVGRPGPGLRVARIEPRHPRRPQGQRVDRRQRRQGFPPAQVHQGRKIPHAGGQDGAQERQQRSGEFRAASPRSGSIPRPTRRTSPTAIATSAWRCWMPTPAR